MQSYFYGIFRIFSSVNYKSRNNLLFFKVSFLKKKKSLWGKIFSTHDSWWH